MTVAIALILACAVAVLGHVFSRVFRTSRLDAVVLTAVLAEFIKKLAYISIGLPAKPLSLVLAAPLLLTAAWWSARPQATSALRHLAAPAGWLLLWFVTLAFFTFRNPEGSPLVLTSYLVFWLWIPAAAGMLGEAGRWTYRVLLVAVGVALINQVFGPDLLWRAYGAVAEPVSIGARYMADRGYSGAIFSSPADFGAFVLAASALLAAATRRPRALAPVSLVAAALTGGRYVMLAVALFWVALAWSRVSRLRPWQALAAVFAYSPLQDAVGRRIIESPPGLATSSSPFLQRLFTVGTLGARVGFVEAWSNTFSRHWLVGIGLIDVFGIGAFYPDDRHNLILWLVLRGGILALLSYFAFAWIHFRHFARNPRVGRIGTAFILAALVMSMGGPHALNAWFFLALGVLFHRVPIRTGERSGLDDRVLSPVGRG